MPMTGFQTKTTLRGLLDAAGIGPKKRYGQCFLIDRNLMEKLVEAAEIGASDCVLEVGCGTASLTSLLAERAKRVVAVDVDTALLEIASLQVSEHENVAFVAGDALENKSTIAPAVVAAVLAARRVASGRLGLVANLPYDIATPLVVNLLLSGMGFARLCFTVQAEVAERFTAGPGTSAYGPVSVVTQALARCRLITKVPRQAFWPSPKVASAMLRLDVHLPRDPTLADPAALSWLVRRCFQFRRKTMTHIAKEMALGEAFAPALAAAGVDPAARPEDVTVRQWIVLHGAGGWKAPASDV